MTVKRVNPLSCAKVAGVLYALMGLIFGLFFSLFGAIGAFGAMSALSGDEAAGAGLIGALFGVGAIVVMPIFYGCLGFITTLIGAALYNLVAGMVGGIEIDVAQ